MSDRPNIEELKRIAGEVSDYAGTEWKATMLNDDEPLVVRVDEPNPGWDSSYLSKTEAAHIATCDPKTIMEVCAYVEHLEAKYENACKELGDLVNGDDDG